MLKTACISVTFSVRVETTNNEQVCVVGSTKDLGEWLPHQALLLKKEHKHDSCVWTTTVNLAGGSGFEYRYFVGYVRDAETEGEERDVMVLRWETNTQPRQFTTSNASSSSDFDSEGIATFGVYGGKCSIDRGWLHEETEVHLRLHTSPLKIWKNRYKNQQFRIKCTPLDLLHRDASFYEDGESSHDVQQASAFNKIYVYNLGGSSAEAECKEQPLFGSPYIDNINSYMVFKCRAWEPDYLGYMFDLYADKGSDHYHEHIGSAHLLPINLRSSSGFINIPINRKDRPIGELTVDYLMVKPMKGYRCDMRCTYPKHWKTSKPLDVGHRGMGSSNTTKTKCAAVRENTIASLQEAYDHGADFVEFDVQLSKDDVPVVYHDYLVCMSLKKKNSGVHDWFEMPVHQLSLNHLQSLHLDYASERTKSGSPDASPTKLDPVNTHLFPTLQECFQQLVPDLGFLIEVKYCMPLKNGRLEDDITYYTERNKYVDCILRCVLRNAGNRQIILCSFDPDVCVMLRVKQNRYPVMFICMEEANKDLDYWDRRTRTLPVSTNFAHSQQLLGMSVQVASLQKHPDTVKYGKDLGLVMFGWVDHDIEESNEIHQLRKMGLNGVIYDRISEVKPKDNIFQIEQSVQAEIMLNSPAQCLNEGNSFFGETSSPDTSFGGRITSEIQPSPSTSTLQRVDSPVDPHTALCNDNRKSGILASAMD